MTNQSLSVDCIIFDMDGLLTDTEEVCCLAYTTALKELGYTLNRSDYLPLLGRDAAFADRYIEKMFPGIDINGFNNRLAELQNKIICDRGPDILKPGAAEILNLADVMGIKKAVASSNSQKNVIRTLTAAGIVERFDTLVFDTMAKRAKPFPDLFSAASRLTHTAPENCLVLEDSFAGVRAAEAAEMRVIIVPDMLTPSDDITKKCVRCCSSLFGAMDYITSVNQK